MPDALPAATLPIHPGMGHTQEYAALHNPWFGSVNITTVKKLTAQNGV